ncbi:hypothetical protein [Paracoccus aestuarii]|uniref:hypothetical protein n=1 Tax=Paracoccus aestuarii TaxID=453842 RepID=UPI0011C4902C|nr:hypothetical protein [Paracoccus aestuarii]WCQ99568.1 hypothetical protein JHW48_02130 [Paracoccus aestuarii]
MSETDEKIARLKAIMWTGISNKPTQDEIAQLHNEVETICGDLYETQHDWLMKQDPSAPHVGIDYFEQKLHGMKAAVLAALRIDRDSVSDDLNSSNFEHFSYIVESDLRH